MTERPGPEPADQPRIDLGKQRATGGEQSAYPPPPPPAYQQGGYQQGGYQQGGYQHPQWPGHPGQVGRTGLPGPDERLWGGAAHWSALVAMAVAMAFLGPLLVLLLKGDSPYVRRQATESLNFQLTVLVAGLVSVALAFIGIGLLLLPLVGLFWLVFTVLGSIKASAGEEYRYPLTLRMVR